MRDEKLPIIWVNHAANGYILQPLGTVKDPDDLRNCSIAKDAKEAGELLEAMLREQEIAIDRGEV
jgi:hypothetical protein